MELPYHPLLLPSFSGPNISLLYNFVYMKIVLLRAINLLVRGGGVLGLIFAGYLSLASQSPYPIIVCSVANYLYFSFCPLSINYRTIHKENKIILSRRAPHLGTRLILCPLVKFYIMTAKKKQNKTKQKNRIDIILRTIIDPILVTFGQIHNFRDPNLVTFYLCIYLILNEEHFTHTYSTNILVRLLTVNVKNYLTPKIRKCATRF